MFEAGVFGTEVFVAEVLGAGMFGAGKDQLKFCVVGSCNLYACTVDAKSIQHLCHFWRCVEIIEKPL